MDKKEIEKLERAVVDAALLVYHGNTRITPNIVGRAEALEDAAKALSESRSLLPSSEWMESRAGEVKDLADGDAVQEALRHWRDCMRVLKCFRDEKVQDPEASNHAMHEFHQELNRRIGDIC